MNNYQEEEDDNLDLFDEEEEETEEEEAEEESSYDDEPSASDDDDPELEIGGRVLRFSELENIVKESTNLSTAQTAQVPGYTQQLQNAGASDPQMQKFFGYLQNGYTPRQAFVAIAKEIVDQELPKQEEEEREPEFETLDEQIRYTAMQATKELREEIAHMKKKEQERIMEETGNMVESQNNSVIVDVLEDFGIDPNDVLANQEVIKEMRKAFTEAFSTHQSKVDVRWLMRSVPLTKRQVRMVLADVFASKEIEKETKKASRTDAIRKLQTLPKSLNARSASKQLGGKERKIDGVSMEERSRRVNELFG